MDTITPQQQNTVVPANPNTKVIKRYQNRKLYDTQQSCYVTLEDIAKMIRNNEDVLVIDNKSKKDITSSTLTQIIFEAEKKAKNFISLGTLREIIQTGTGSISSYLEKALNKPMGVNATDENQGEVGAYVKELLENTTRSFDDIQKKIENRLAQASKGAVGNVKDSLSQLQQKLNTIETKIKEFSLDN